MRTVFPIFAGLLLAAQSMLAPTVNQIGPGGAPFAAEAVSPGDMGAGSLLLPTPETGRYMPVPEVSTVSI